VLDQSEEEYQQNDGHRRAIGEWGGCRLVLLVLDLELDKGDRANRGVIMASISFLNLWNHRADRTTRRDTMLRFDGVDAVMRAMQAFPEDSSVKSTGVACLVNFSVDYDKRRLEELVQKNCIPFLARVMTTRTNAETTRKYAVVVLGRLCDVADPACFEGHVDASAMGAMLDLFNAYKNSNDPFADEVRKACRALSSKMFEWLKSRRRMEAVRHEGLFRAGASAKATNACTS
jgi:hypothetical protein